MPDTMLPERSGAGGAPGGSAGPGFTVKILRNGWRLFSFGRLAGTPFRLILVQPEAGVALLELEPGWTPGAMTLFRRTLEEAGFFRLHPGYLPVIHRSVKEAELPHLDSVLAEAFIGLDPIHVAAQARWADTLQRILTAGRATPLDARPGRPAEPERSPWRVILAAGGGLALAGAALIAGPLLLREAPPTAPPASLPTNRPAGQAAPERASAAPPSDEAMGGERSAGIRAAAEGRPGEPPAQAVDVPDPAPSLAPLETTAPPAEPALELPEPPPLLAPAAELQEAIPSRREAAELPQPPAAPDPQAVVAALPETPFEPPVAAEPPLPLPADPLPVAPPAGPAASSSTEGPSASTSSPPPGPVDAPPPVIPPAVIPPPVIPPAAIPPSEPWRAAVMADIASSPAPPPVANGAAPGDRPERPAEEPRPAPIAAAPALPARPPADPALSAAMQRRGEALLRVGDISGARRFFERAAEAGSAAAALAMAETFDPRVLARSGVVGLQPDRAAALLWYRRAAALGSPDAEARIASLEAEP